jgi:hypothetical protein
MDLFSSTPRGSSMMLYILCKRGLQFCAPDSVRSLLDFVCSTLPFRDLPEEDAGEAPEAAEHIVRVLQLLSFRPHDQARFANAVALVTNVFSAFQSPGVQAACLTFWASMCRRLNPDHAYAFALRLPNALFLQNLGEGKIAEPERMDLFVVLARAPRTIDVLFNAGVMPALFLNHGKFRYATRKCCCLLYVEITNNGSKDQLCKIIGSPDWTKKFFELVVSLLEADDPQFQGALIGALRTVFVRVARDYGEMMLGIVRNAFLEAGGLRGLELVEGENAALAEQLVLDFNLDPAEGMDTPEAEFQRGDWNGFVNQ